VLFGASMLLAQGFQKGFNQGFNQGFQGGQNNPIGGICQSLHLLVYIGILVYILIMNYNALNAVSPRNRDMQPGMVFLSLIPCFNLIWYFFIVSAVSSSLQKEFDDRGIRSDGDFGKSVGITGGVLACICCTLGWMICAVIQAVKMHGYIQQLQGRSRRRKIRDDDDDDDDDRPRKRRSRDDDDEDDDDDRPSRRRRRRDEDDD
jgi:hypothetical protein